MAVTALGALAVLLTITVRAILRTPDALFDAGVVLLPRSEGIAETREEWRVTDDPGAPYPRYEFVWPRPAHPGEDAEAEARMLIRGVNEHGAWVDGPHLHRRTVVTTPWERVSTPPPVKPSESPANQSAATPSGGRQPMSAARLALAALSGIPVQCPTSCRCTRTTARTPAASCATVYASGSSTSVKT